MHGIRLIRDKAGQWHRPPYKLPVPRQLMPFQREGGEWLTHRTGSILGDDMGLGKTAQAIYAINRLPQDARILIVTPSGLRINWLRELAIWLQLERRAQIAKRYLPETPIAIVSFDQLSKFEAQMRAVEFDLAVIDEAHYLRNPYTIRCRQVIGDQYTLPIFARRKILLTGTPMTKDAADLWPLFYWLGLKMSRAAFKAKAAQDPLWLQSALRWYMLRRMKAEVLKELPAKTRQIIRITPAAGARAAVMAEVTYEHARARLGQFKGCSFEETAALRRRTAHAKLALADVQEHLLEAVASSKKLVVFCIHHSTVMQVCDIFAHKGITALPYHGGMDANERQRAIDRFQADQAAQVIALTIGAGGTGITLTAASHVIFVEESWDPSETSQAEDRVHRHGQKNAVLIQHLVVDGSIDCREVEVQLDKQARIDRVVNAA